MTLAYTCPRFFAFGASTYRLIKLQKQSARADSWAVMLVGKSPEQNSGIACDYRHSCSHMASQAGWRITEKNTQASHATVEAADETRPPMLAGECTRRSSGFSCSTCCPKCVFLLMPRALPPDVRSCKLSSGTLFSSAVSLPSCVDVSHLGMLASLTLACCWSKTVCSLRAMLAAVSLYHQWMGIMAIAEPSCSQQHASRRRGACPSNDSLQQLHLVHSGVTPRMHVPDHNSET